MSRTFQCEFSVVITSHNQSAFIMQAVDSVLQQRYPAREVIVVDDGSSDGSPEMLSQYGAKILLTRMPRNRGANPARNMGAAKASGDYIVFLDGDDVMFPWTLDAYARIAKAKNPKLILSKLFFFSGFLDTKAVPYPEVVQVCVHEELMRKDRSFRASASAIVVDRCTFLAAGGWTEDIFPMDDLDLIAKLGYSGEAVQILDPPAIGYRLHAANTVQQVQRCMHMIFAIVQKEKRWEYPGGKGRRFERYALIGGASWFWIKKGFRNRFYAEALQLLARTWPLVGASALLRISLLLRGKSRLESISLGSAAG